MAMATRAATEYALFMGFGEAETTLVVTSVLEVARNILVHAGKGTVTFRRCSMGEKRGLEVVFADQGPGIEDIQQVLRDHYSTNGSLGIGLPAAKRMMDELEIESEPGKGTTIWIRKWL